MEVTSGETIILGDSTGTSRNTRLAVVAFAQAGMHGLKSQV